MSGGEQEDAASMPVEEDSEVPAVNGDENEEDGEAATTGLVAEEDPQDLNDEPDAEGEEQTPEATAAPEPPSYAKASSFPFRILCKRLETIWQSKSKKNRKRGTVSAVQRLKVLLPPQDLERFDAFHAVNLKEAGQRPESLFPILRLLMPEKDTSRFFNMKERTLAQLYAEAFGLSKTQLDYKRLEGFGNPSLNGDVAGDFSLVLERVLSGRIATPASGVGKFTVGDINERLDELANMPRKVQEMKSNHDWRQSASDSGRKKKKRKGPTLRECRAQWLRGLNPPSANGLTPVEHKWLVRILQSKLNFGLGAKAILDWYNPVASSLWASHNSLKAVCNKLCTNPEFLQIKQQQQAGNNNETTSGLSTRRYMQGSPSHLEFGKPFEPMYSDRTGFDKVLTDVSLRHRLVAKAFLEDGNDNLGKTSLALRHPTFSVETKLDGERMLIHYSGQTGVVKIHTRRANWYSEQYSPVLGPDLRRAVGSHKMDMILDGEILAWDDQRKETIPFGNNRTIARLRRQWMQRHGLLDERDTGMHDGDKESKSVTHNWQDDKNHDLDHLLAGAECWLQFVAFDLVYLNGPGAAELLEETVSSCIQPRPKPGSLQALDGFERKKLLYRLVKPLEHKIEIVHTMIIRPNGKVVLGRDYFSWNSPLEECEMPASTLDSIECRLRGQVSAEVDTLRRRRLSDAEISQQRARAVEDIYKQTVEDSRMEGLLFKDLSAPYVLGDLSKALKYWLKFKPDYFNGSFASDLDLVICGAYHATGLKHAGRPSSFLCACVDTEDSNVFMPVCKVNVGSMEFEQQRRCFDRTGFSISNTGGSGGAAVELGSWFVPEDMNHIPDFISQRSHIDDVPDGEWRFQKNDYPDLWINPENSVVVVLNAGEIVRSEAFPAGLTLRFPRITRVREGADDKPPQQCESDLSLWAVYNKVTQERASNAAGAMVAASQDQAAAVAKPCRFLTEEQHAAKEKAKKSQRRGTSSKPKQVHMAQVSTVKSQVLNGIKFVVLDGRYALNATAAEEAREEGWLESHGKTVTSHHDVQVFVQEHGGTVCLAPSDTQTIVLGGTETDPKVTNFCKAVENAAAVGASSGRVSKKAMQQAILQKQSGVVRWMFVYSLVLFRWKDKTSIILDENPALCKPSILDYLKRPATKRLFGGDGSLEFDLCTEELANACAMKRALKLLSTTSATNAVTSDEEDDETKQCSQASWREIAETELLEPHRWIAGCKRQRLWPYHQEANEHRRNKVVIYPDMFENVELNTSITKHESTTEYNAQSIAKEEDPVVTNAEFLSVLPLGRAMGATITNRLSTQVTHVLCRFVAGEPDVKKDHAAVNRASFADARRGGRLLRQLGVMQRLVEQEDEEFPAITFVSPEWLRQQWDHGAAK